MKFDKPKKKVAVKISLTIHWFHFHTWMRSAERLFDCECGYTTFIQVRVMAFETDNNIISRYPPLSQLSRMSVLFHLRNG